MPCVRHILGSALLLAIWGAPAVLRSAESGLSSGADFERVERFPRWSWDKVPVYQMFGHDSRMLKPEEIKKISDSCDFICIEKQHGNRALGSADEGAKVEIAKFRKAKPDIRALVYFNSAYAYAMTSYCKGFGWNKVSEKHRPFFIVDSKTGELANRGKTYFFDVLNKDLRVWWAKSAGDFVRSANADGLFVDQMHAFSWMRPEKRKEVGAAQAEMMAMTKKAIGKDKLLLLNNAAHIPPLFDIGDGFMFEHYNPSTTLSKTAIKKDWDLMKKISLAGKFSVWRVAPDTKGTKLEGMGRREAHHTAIAQFEKHAQQNITFYLGCFLMGMQPYSYFQYGWGWGLETGPLTDFPELNKRVGKPRSDYVVDKNNRWVFTRGFEFVSVEVDLEKREAVIHWKE